MKKTWFQKLVPLLLVASFLISTPQLVFASEISVGVAFGDVFNLSSFDLSVQSLADGYRVSCSMTPLDDLYYWASHSLSSSPDHSSISSFDSSWDNSSVSATVYYNNSSSSHYLYVYPAGKNLFRLPCLVDNIYASRVDITADFDGCNYFDSVSGYKYGALSAQVQLLCFDASRSYISSVFGSSRSYSGSSTFSHTFSGTGLTIPDNTVYICPVIRVTVPAKSYSSEVGRAYVSVNFSGLSYTMTFDVSEPLFSIDGIWEAKSSSPTVTDSITEKVNFTSGGIQYDTMEYSYRAPTGNQRERHNLSYIAGKNILTARSDGWHRDCSKVVDFGSEPQMVSPQYYAFLTDHFTRISDSPEYGTPVNLKIYDYSGDNLLASCDTSRQVYLALTAAAGSANDLFVFEPGTDNVWSDDDVILASVGFEYSDVLITGVSLSRYGPPIDMEEITDSYFLATLYSGAELYLIREGDEVPEGGSSGSEGEEGWFNLYDYDGETLIDQFWVTFPVTVKVKEDGFHLIDYQEDVSSWQYVYDGDGTYAGLTYGSANSDRFLFTPGTGFVLSSESSIYLTCKDDLTNSDGSGGSGGSDDSGDDSGGSSGDGSGGLGDLDGSGLGNSAGDLSGAGDQLGDVIGDVNDISGQLPDFPDDLGGIISDHLTNFYDSPILGLMPWNDGEYGYVWDFLFAPTLTTLSVSLLLYFVFGKAEVK